MATKSELWIQNCSLDVGERVVNVGASQVRTRFLRLRSAVQVNGWRVWWLGGWDRGRMFFVVMVERKSRAKKRVGAGRRPCVGREATEAVDDAG
jgi:hypothetical protein